MDHANDMVQPPSETFVWHPDYAGKSFEDVRHALEDDIERDQRAYNLALEQAEKEEFDAFNSIRELEKRWSVYDFGWVDVPPKVLADRILAFERVREERQDLISWQDWKAEAVPQQQTSSAIEAKTDWRANLTDEQRRKLASAMSILVLAGVAVVCVAVYMLVR